jgi:endonuclease/exonuclease/phosphatase family metal-dependent hydrolase
MKIVSWNIGNFIWIKHFPGRKHYCFQSENITEVSDLIKKENADIVFLQEILQDDVNLIYNNFPEFEHKISISTIDRESKSIFLSKYKIQDIEHTNSHDYIINGITFFPVHLNAFSPKKRYEQASYLLKDLPNENGIILGDTNFWIFKNYFLSSKDRTSYDKLLHNHIDILKHLGHTCRIFLALDKIFTTKDIKTKNQKIVKHKIGHMDHYLISAEIENLN